MVEKPVRRWLSGLKAFSNNSHDLSLISGPYMVKERTNSHKLPSDLYIGRGGEGKEEEEEEEDQAS